ncbi:rho guanine nucleotide exchange factor TIAM2-like [Antennarius striatus]|uniref:rho guanine nucleotide exchange factor TIAM2-like n=1 Tax=Antennarius striatus TaxID=241820 RepID=UPI0035B47EC5
MGNKDSHGVGPPAPPSPSIRFSSRRGEEPSARGWWRSGRGRSNPNLYPPTSPYTSWRYEHQPNGAALGGGRPPGGAANRLDGSSEGSSPKVLLGKDSSMRVEFTKTKPLPLERQGLLGGGSAPDSALRTSKGSSISSDGSWYDSPWGGGAEPVGNLFVEDGRYPTWAPARNQETPVAGGNALILPGFPSNGSAPGAGYNTCSSGRTEDSGVGDSLILQPDLKDSGLAPPPGASLWVYPCYNKLPAFPTAPDASSQKATATPPSAAQEAVPEGGAGPTGAPHRNNRKDFLKTRIREISDWTGSLSRKRRRVQEPSGSGAGGSDSLWTPNPLDLQRQNIDHGFLQQLGGGARTRASEGEGEGETDGGVEEEQGVVRRAGWLSFKALLTLRGDGRLELVTRRRWRRFWVTLKGCSLLLYQTADRAGPPRGVLPADDGLVQAVPEHPRREHVFCVSNAHGDVFLLQEGGPEQVGVALAQTKLLVLTSCPGNRR